MNILCDTCSILMLIRIAPDMFVDERYDCATIIEVRNEIFKTQKFKSKYPWRDKYKGKIQPIPYGKEKIDEAQFHFELVSNLANSAVYNKKTGRIFDLSWVDRKIVSYALTYGLSVSSTDNDLIHFIEQEFDKSNNYPLSILNSWLKSGLVKFEFSLEAIIEEWTKNNEPPQPKIDIFEFERITKHKYLGP